MYGGDKNGLPPGHACSEGVCGANLVVVHGVGRGEGVSDSAQLWEGEEEVSGGRVWLERRVGRVCKQSC